MGKRRLSDLYVVGAKVSVDDGTGDPIDVWIQKLNTNDNEKALRRAAAARAGLMALKNTPESEDYQGIVADVHDLSKKEIVEALAEEELGKRAAALEASLTGEDEWEKDDYLDGLRDAWEGTDDAPGLWNVWIETEGADAESKRVYDELNRFNDQAEKLINKERADIVKAYDKKSEDTLRGLWCESKLKSEADQAWLREYRRAEIWLGVREVDNHDVYYFEDRGEVDKIAHEVLLQLLTAYRDLSIEPLEGKDSPGTPASSSQSDSPEKQEVDSPSTPETV